MAPEVGLHADAGPGARFDPGERWVPVDGRWLGLDRRTLVPALVVLAVAALMSIVLPAANKLTPYDDEVVEGDVVSIGVASFVPA